MTSPSVETATEPLDIAESKSPAPLKPVRTLSTLAVVAAPAAGVTALLIHNLIPNQQTSQPTRAYPLLLQILLTVSIVVVIFHRAWRPLGQWMRGNGPLFAGGFLWLGLWDLITLKLNLMPLPYFPGPDMVFQGMLDDRAILMDSTFCSLRLLLTGYVSGVVVGFASGVMIGCFRPIRYWAMPALKFAGPIPATALIPLAFVLFPNTFLSGAALIAWAAWFPVTILTMSGIANVPTVYLDAAQTLGADRGYLIFRVMIPAALPTIFVGVFMGMLASFLALYVAETVGVRNGLGY